MRLSFQSFFPFDLHRICVFDPSCTVTATTADSILVLFCCPSSLSSFSSSLSLSLSLLTLSADCRAFRRRRSSSSEQSGVNFFRGSDREAAAGEGTQHRLRIFCSSSHGVFFSFPLHVPRVVIAFVLFRSVRVLLKVPLPCCILLDPCVFGCYLSTPRVVRVL